MIPSSTSRASSSGSTSARVRATAEGWSGGIVSVREWAARPVADLLVGEPRPGRTTTDRGRKVVKNRIEEIELEQGVLRDAYIARR